MLVGTKKGNTNQKTAQLKAQAIMSKARALFYQHGYDGVSLTDIAIAMDCTRYSIQLHFPNKEAIFFAILANAYQDMWVSVWCQVPQTGTGYEKLKAALVALAQYEATQQDLFVLLGLSARLMGQSTTTGHEKFMEIHLEVVRNVEGLVEAGQQDSSIRSDVSGNRLAYGLMLNVAGIFNLLGLTRLSSMNHCPVEDRVALVADHFTVYLEGMLPQRVEQKDVVMQTSLSTMRSLAVVS